MTKTPIETILKQFISSILQAARHKIAKMMLPLSIVTVGLAFCPVGILSGWHFVHTPVWTGPYQHSASLLSS